MTEYKIKFNNNTANIERNSRIILDRLAKTGFVPIPIVEGQEYYWKSRANVDNLIQQLLCYEDVEVIELQGNLLR
jgi:hypothetical protein